METDELTAHPIQPNDKDENVFYTLHELNANICPTAVTDKNLLYQQSVAISLCVISFNCINDVEKWSHRTLDNIINKSNHFFEPFCKTENLLNGIFPPNSAYLIQVLLFHIIFSQMGF